MPATSKAQFRFMKGVESGSIKAPGLSKNEAHKFTAGVDYKDLPAKKKIQSRLSARLKRS